jgi:hypothetical protein
LNDIDAATADVEEFASAAGRAGRHVHSSQLKLASEIIFSDGQTTLASAASHVEAAWQAERMALERREAQRQERLAYVAAGTGLVSILVVVLLMPTAHPPEATLPVEEEARAASESVPRPAIEPRDQLPVATPLAEPPPVSSGAPAPTTSTSDDLMRQDRRRAIELKAMAELCTDFARLSDSSELAGLLERAARLIDASGVIVWVADPQGGELNPALAHGYGIQALSRLPSIPRGADNATAAAWRDMEMQVVKTNGMTPGALVAPMLTGGGCVGVLAAEVRHGRESSESIRALTRIVAAQIAGIVTVPEAHVTSATEAAHSV